MTKFYFICSKCHINLSASAMRIVGASVFCSKCKADGDKVVKDYLMAVRKTNA